MGLFLRGALSLFHRVRSGLERCEGILYRSETHNPFGTAREVLGSGTQFHRLSSVPVKVTAVAVSDRDQRLSRSAENTFP